MCNHSMAPSAMVVEALLTIRSLSGLCLGAASWGLLSGTPWGLMKKDANTLLMQLQSHVSV